MRRDRARRCLSDEWCPGGPVGDQCFPQSERPARASHQPATLGSTSPIPPKAHRRRTFAADRRTFAVGTTSAAGRHPASTHVRRRLHPPPSGSFARTTSEQLTRSRDTANFVGLFVIARSEKKQKTTTFQRNCRRAGPCSFVHLDQEVAVSPAPVKQQNGIAGARLAKRYRSRVPGKERRWDRWGAAGEMNRWRPSGKAASFARIKKKGGITRACQQLDDRAPVRQGEGRRPIVGHPKNERRRIAMRSARRTHRPFTSVVTSARSRLRLGVWFAAVPVACLCVGNGSGSSTNSSSGPTPLLSDAGGG